MKASKMASMTLALVMLSSFGFTTSAEATETFQGAGEPVSEVLSTLKVRPQSRKPSDRSNLTWNHVEGKKGSYSTRDLILDRDLTDVSYKSNGRVKEGDFVDPYTGTSFKFEAGTGRQHDGGIQLLVDFFVFVWFSVLSLILKVISRFTNRNRMEKH